MTTRLAEEVEQLRVEVRAYRKEFERIMKTRMSVLVTIAAAVVLILVVTVAGFVLAAIQQDQTLTQAGEQACEQVAEVRFTLASYLEAALNSATQRDGETDEEYSARVDIVERLLNDLRPQPCGGVDGDPRRR